ncbi:hypothetical protein MKZ38_009316 [Zalerion maritima]|uniref:Uncharacterized protein n=1 Tax=Zalerion maritima TaxID=339359 RepID=A0AAD5RGG6_9PEZI|nr:hypothetical protein MKZ38_009316 [Zalerion maritima]
MAITALSTSETPAREAAPPPQFSSTIFLSFTFLLLQLLLPHTKKLPACSTLLPSSLTKPFQTRYSCATQKTYPMLSSSAGAGKGCDDLVSASEAEAILALIAVTLEKDSPTPLCTHGGTRQKLWRSVMEKVQRRKTSQGCDCYDVVVVQRGSNSEPTSWYFQEKEGFKLSTIMSADPLDMGSMEVETQSPQLSEQYQYPQQYPDLPNFLQDLDMEQPIPNAETELQGLLREHSKEKNAARRPSKHSRPSPISVSVTPPCKLFFEHVSPGFWYNNTFVWDLEDMDGDGDSFVDARKFTLGFHVQDGPDRTGNWTAPPVEFLSDDDMMIVMIMMVDEEVRLGDEEMEVDSDEEYQHQHQYQNAPFDDGLDTAMGLD